MLGSGKSSSLTRQSIRDLGASVQRCARSPAAEDESYPKVPGKRNLWDKAVSTLLRRMAPRGRLKSD